MQMSSSKQKVVVGANFIIVQKHRAVHDKFIFGNDKLIIFNEQNNSPDVSLLKLYPEKNSCIKLIKFHFSNKHAVFFF